MRSNLNQNMDNTKIKYKIKSIQDGLVQLYYKRGKWFGIKLQIKIETIQMKK